MTCVVGVTNGSKIWLGWDSCASNDYQKLTVKNPKGFKSNGMLIGFSGSLRIGQAIEHLFTPPKNDSNKDDFSYLVSEWIPALQEVFRTHGMLKTENECEKLEDGSEVVIGWNGRLYSFSEDMALSEPAYDYCAIGGGSSVALGALFASTKADPKSRIELALEAAQEHSVGVRGPVVVIKG